ncbi:VanZ family protein [Pelagibacterium xiamenense]|uniref:VanZ family protein n=1 Tax=Pelagibacterium xiamenense TaxID=2901140 RepID=UPI001E285124|nr:VanZ family protein [Pelagibacterium xiamenense]MCD7060098.1 VanZ family protein [Pelagibacterium xiamenense]
MTGSRFAKVLAWTVLAAFLLLTLGPVGWRPHIHGYANLERFMGFAVAAFVFVLAYPRRIVLILTGLAAIIVGLEALQLLRPDRHGAVMDVVYKFAGMTLGVASGWVAVRLSGLRRSG